MALSQAQILDALLLLGLPVKVEEAYKYGFGDDVERYRLASEARKLLETVDAAQETKVGSILTQYAAIEFDTDTIKAEGLDSSAARTRSRLAGMLRDVIGLRVGGGGFTIERC